MGLRTFLVARAKFNKINGFRSFRHLKTAKKHLRYAAFDRLNKQKGGGHTAPLVLPFDLYPFTLPAVSPCTKNFWQIMNTATTGTSVSTDMANT